jgi:hypothetical protein
VDPSAAFLIDPHDQMPKKNYFCIIDVDLSSNLGCKLNRDKFLHALLRVDRKKCQLALGTHIEAST